MTIAFISHPDCLRHEMGPHHAEQPARLSAIDDRLIGWQRLLLRASPGSPR